MVFNSYIFIMVFLPAVLAGWYILNALRRPRLAELFLMGMSAWFYGSFSVWNLAVLVCSAVVNYLISWLLDQCPEEKKRRILMWAAVAFHILMLSVFKYGAGIRVYAGISLLMPVGLSFWTFSQISYIVDRARGELKREPFWDYLLYISFFPKLAEGPITNYTEVMTQFRDPVKRIPDRVSPQTP